MRKDVSILVADAKFELAAVLRNQLADGGFCSVEIAKGMAEAATRLAMDRQFDLVICDAGANPAAGPTFAQTIRTHPLILNPLIPIIVAAFNPTASVVRACRDAGANAIIARPASTAQIRDKVTAVLSQEARFVESCAYFGPDRRRNMRPYRGPERRARNPAPARTTLAHRRTCGI